MPYLQDEEMFCFTYGDGVADVNITALIDFHKQHGKLVSLTAVQPTGKFGALRLDEDGGVSSFSEKPKGDGRWVNGGFLVLSPKVAAYLKDDTTVWEREPMETIAREGNVAAYKHSGFWQPMDTVHDRAVLENLWHSVRLRGRFGNDLEPRPSTGDRTYPFQGKLKLEIRNRLREPISGCNGRWRDAFSLQGIGIS
jgi:glucose-1-phosphate cytidylyltransferase